MPGDTLGLWLTLIIAGTAANGVWRVAGVWLSRGIDPKAPLMLWVRDISVALVAALVARLLLAPTGELAAVGAGVRFLAFGTGIVAYLLSGRHLAVALACAEAMLFAAQWALPAGLQ